MSDNEVVVGKEIYFDIRERPRIVYNCPGPYVQRTLLLFNRWMLPLSRKHTVRG